ncbi:hypothetical protein AMTRI_Chr13g92580 [Amborella trichopoda]|uniref:Cyclin-like domain-containing protein n=1 Tax=Amborella trichopoda TaxID=13333 RepID=U5CW45_AMBTC|nr:plant-specific TFIIB-related protein 1 [Amborella trichopoda]ERN17516.1 hypothetical protein AMTR_s00059p00086280 [Amborella trichopoda]|eukprot:XP_006856049.3 plant-specific TFIIB-related protein 1 [Amborella trichopoda]
MAPCEPKVTARCPYCSGPGPARSPPLSAVARSAMTAECTSCGRVVGERQTVTHELFFERAQYSPLCIVTPDLSNPANLPPPMADDPFESTGFITAFSAFSLDLVPVFTRSAWGFSGYLGEMERVLMEFDSDALRAYLQIVDVSSILGVERDISDHAIQLFRDCACTTYLRNRNVEALATAALVQAVREAQEPRTLQEISAAANVPQKEIGKYIKILGDALKLSQPINSNSISVHMPRFCSLLQLNKSTQDLATHIGEVVINKCFCTRRNPISISAAAIYLSCQLEDKRKTQAEICKVTGLTEVTLRKVYKELLENWDDLLPPNYTPAVPPEKAFPMTVITSNRSKLDPLETISPTTSHFENQKQSEIPKPPKIQEASENGPSTKGKEKESDPKTNSRCPPPIVPYGLNIDPRVFHEMAHAQAPFWQQPQLLFGLPAFRPEGEKIQRRDQLGQKKNRDVVMRDVQPGSSRSSDFKQKVDRDVKNINDSDVKITSDRDANINTSTNSTVSSGMSNAQWGTQFSGVPGGNMWPVHGQLVSGGYVRFVQPQAVSGFGAPIQGVGSEKDGSCGDRGVERLSMGSSSDRMDCLPMKQDNSGGSGSTPSDGHKGRG